VVRLLDVVWLAAHFAKFSALNAGKLGMLKANSSAADIELRAAAGKEVGRASFWRGAGGSGLSLHLRDDASRILVRSLSAGCGRIKN
jgi:hypothetical protein